MTALIGWPTADEGSEGERLTCSLCGSRELEQLMAERWCEPLAARAQLCQACADDEEAEARRLYRDDDYADALARREERDR